TAPVLPTAWAANGVGDALTGRWGGALGWTALLAGVTSAGLVLGTRAMGALYLSGWSQTALAGAGGRRRVRRTAAGRGPLAWLLLDPAIEAIIRKDWAVRRRDVVLLVRSILPLFFLGILLLRNPAGMLEFIRGLGPGPAGALLGVAPALFLLLAISSELGLGGVGLEGGAIWIFAVSPNPMRRLLLGKCLAAAVPTVALATLVGSLLEGLAGAGVGWSAGAVALLALTAGCLSVVLVCLGALAPRFDWTDPRRIVRPAIGWLAVLCETGLFAAVALAAATPVALAAWLGLPTLPLYVLGLALGAVVATVAALLAIPIAATRLSMLELGAGLVEQPLGD
ncbi:MAG TPA: hypothetical protein VG245_08030, partial [Candidatus Dormibacteraeota bacterium]|nr:hypothetical protein [Candidatus Dormibacteraeota bacterium]